MAHGIAWRCVQRRLVGLQGTRAEAAVRSKQLSMYHVRAGASTISYRAIEIAPVRAGARVSAAC